MAAEKQIQRWTAKRKLNTKRPRKGIFSSLRPAVIGSIVLTPSLARCSVWFQHPTLTKMLMRQSKRRFSRVGPSPLSRHRSVENE